MDRMPMPGKEPTHAIAACESECDLCNECIFEGSPVCDVGTGWSHLDCIIEEGLPYPIESDADGTV
jgi:hypothetical protein